MKKVLLLLAVNALMSGAELKLIPYPQSVVSGVGELVLKAPVRVAVVSKVQADRFAAELLFEDFNAVASIRPELASNARKGIAILIGRAGDPALDKEIAHRAIDASVLDKGESYVLNVDETGVLLAAKSEEGVFYGVQTLRQLIRPAPRPDMVVLPYVKIADWPALRYRGLSVDISRGPIPTEDQMRLVIRTLAEYKMNMLSFYMEQVFTYTHSPGVAPEGAEITPELIKRLAEYARDYHVELVPQQQMFGHLHHMLKFDLYSPMAELPHGHVLAAGNEKAFDWVRQAAMQLAEVFPGTFLHIGCDETVELGRGQSKARADKIGVGAVYMERMARVMELLRPLNRRVMFWGDIALKHPELISKLPRDLVAMTWAYDPRPDYSKMILPFRENGMDVFVCPGLSNWHQIYPNLSDATVNINNFVRDGKRLGAIGMLNTDWEAGGEVLFHMAWYPVVFSAAAAWQPGSVDTAAFDRAFDWAFYRNDGETFIRAIRNLNRVHDLLRAAGDHLGMWCDACDGLLWFDPFSRYGAERVRRFVPAAPELRRIAEQTAIDLASAAPQARKNRFTLPYLRFAAKRLDALGMRLEFAKEIGDLYREATADPRVAPQSLAEINGLMEDLQNSALQLKNEYRNLWLAENRPYFLDTVLVRYDYETLYWLDKSHLFIRASEKYRAEKTLPTPEDLGLVLP
jgi:hypothetical protein